jgi:hypothetical protein
VDNLSLQVAQVYHIGIDDANASYAGGGEVEAHGGTQASGAYHQYSGIHDFLLPFHTHIFQ